MEAFTSGKISTAAKNAYAPEHPWVPETHYVKLHDGYKMFGYESQIAMARACGRGARSGMGLPTHKYDALGKD